VHACTKEEVEIMQTSPLVSAIILNYNGLRYLGQGLKECLDSVLRTNYPNLEVIFVDNGSTDGSVDFVRENFVKSEIRIIKNKNNMGFSEGFNTGIKASKGKYVALLSNDMIVDPNWLKPVIELMESNQQVGLAGFKFLSYGNNNIIDCIGHYLYLGGRVKAVGQHEIDRGQYNTNIDDFDFIGGAMVIRRKTLQQVGLFDPDFKVYSEDVDLCFRIRKGGYKTLYVHDAVIWHKHSLTLRGMDPKGLFREYMINQNRIQFILIHFTLRRILATFLIDTVWFLLLKPSSKMILVKAYLWNLRKMGRTLMKRSKYGPSPPFDCKFPAIETPYTLMGIRKWIKAKLGLTELKE
jgi:hypothetical protein